jgi:hypothetical protein
VSLKKVFILPQFGPLFPWTEDYLTHIATLAPHGWHWKILTPHGYQSKSANVEIVPMTFAEFDARVTQATGVITGNFLDAQDLPSKLVSDYYPAFGEIFSDLLTDCDYWSVTNWDVVFGRLDHFLSDDRLAQCDLWSDDCHHVNSLFCLYKNTPRINALYRQVPDWQIMFGYHGYPLFGFDELHFDQVIRRLSDEGQIVFDHPPYFSLHSYDRLIQHQPTPNLTIMPDGALIECFDDPHPGLANYPPWRGMFGREIMYFHFIQTKRWPSFRPNPASRMTEVCA